MITYISLYLKLQPSKKPKSFFDTFEKNKFYSKNNENDITIPYIECKETKEKMILQSHI